MKAAQINAYGGIEVIQINKNIPKPSPKQGQVLVEVFAASINAIDWKFRAGYLQKMAPVPLPVTLGGDFAGKISEGGEGVSEFNVGDEVYGQAIILNGGSGSFAEYVTANATNTTLKPNTSSFEEAGALPLAGVSAMQALEEHMKLQSGQKILIHGGAGGIGHIAIQLSKVLGAYVVTTVKTEDMEFVKNLGADEVIDYKTQKFEDILKDFDAVFDTVGGETTDKSFAVLKKGGIFVSMLGQPNQDLAQKYGVSAIGQGTQTDTAHLNHLAELVDSGKIKVHVDKVFPLEKVQEAFTYQEEVHPRGKVVIKIR
ncbi:NADP-dependent oxidoreductase [Candidatus Gottesmanbacteria bacterium]|nr:NADP-dependent oxidoreductase [Candidatus Gottesmanbacteria bacterium]